jgi:hypothetical protein
MEVREAAASIISEESLMSKQDEAGLILKLYELRREEKMRKARDWYFMHFNPQTLDDFTREMFGENSAYVRMVVSYWDMAAALVHNGAIDLKLFNETSGEYWGVFMKVEPLLGEIRAKFGPQFAANLEKLVDATPEGRQRLAQMRAQMKGMAAELAARRQEAGVRS